MKVSGRHISALKRGGAHGKCSTKIRHTITATVKICQNHHQHQHHKLRLPTHGWAGCHRAHQPSEFGLPALPASHRFWPQHPAGLGTRPRDRGRWPSEALCGSSGPTNPFELNLSSTATRVRNRPRMTSAIRDHPTKWLSPLGMRI